MGRCGSAYGIQGWLKVISFTDPSDNLLNYKTWLVEHDKLWQAITVQDGKRHGEFLAVKLVGCDDRDQARTYTNDLIAVPRTELPALKKDEYYWADLVGLRVINHHGIELGKIDRLIATGANDVMVVMDDAKHQCWLPYTTNVVKSIDLDKKEMYVEWEQD